MAESEAERALGRLFNLNHDPNAAQAWRDMCTVRDALRAAVGDGGHTEAVREALTKLVAWYRNGLTGEGDLLEIEARHIEKWRDREYPAAALSATPRSTDQQEQP